MTPLSNQGTRPGRHRTAGLSLALALGVACSQAPEDDTTPSATPSPSTAPAFTPGTSNQAPVILASDGGSFRMHFIHPENGAIFYSLDVRDIYSECQDDADACGVTEVFHSTYQDHDYLTFNMSQTSDTGGFLGPATLRRVKLTEPVTPVFSLRELDFSQVPGASTFCDYDPAAPCGSGTLPSCYNVFPHDVEVLRDDPEAQVLDVIIADLLATRILKIHFNYADGNTCGNVEWVLDAATDGYEPYYLPNDVDYLQQDGAEYLLTSHYTASQVLGAGALFLWKRTETDQPWQKVWSYPDDSASGLPYMNTPHGPALEPQSDGSWLLRYGHSRANGDFWKTGYQGAVGLATLTSLEAQPVYRFESDFAPGSVLNPMGFIREVEPTSDHRYLITDSGCEIYFGCPLEGRVYLMSPEFPADALPAPTGQSGAWTAGRTEQHFVTLDTTRVDAYYCDFTTNYESDFLTRGELGQELRAQWLQTPGQCEVVREGR